MPAPDRRGSFTNTAVWSSALVAIAALTVWKFEIWPVGWVATETGTIADERAENVILDNASSAGCRPRPRSYQNCCSQARTF